ncbi:hypothetical protein N0V90_010013 [Kalmusia sp. IMI 367209]|nr:hypothetical protein N0V90_010013 [Kalmusia sp. IMI 367209]
MQRFEDGRPPVVHDEKNGDVEPNKRLLRENEKMADTESQLQRNSEEQSTNKWRTISYLIMYFMMNLSLTFYNKLVLGSVGYGNLLNLIKADEVVCLSLDTHGDTHWNISFGVLCFATAWPLPIEQADSTEMVSIPFHQVMRATTPVFTIIIYRVLYARKYATAIYASIAPVIVGVGLATFGDYHFTVLGFTLTLFGVMLAAIKTVVTNRLMTGRLRLPAYEVLLRMGPMAAVQSLLYSMLTGEFADFMSYVSAGQLDRNRILAVTGNGILAFALNVASFQTNKLAGALSMNICANLKQCLTIVLGAAFWHIRMSAMNGAGILLALGGAAWYSSIEVRGKMQR